MFFLYAQQYSSYYILVEPAIVVVRQEVQVLGAQAEPLRQEWRGALRQPCPPLFGDIARWPADLHVRITLGAAQGASRCDKGAPVSLPGWEHPPSGYFREQYNNNRPDKTDGHSGMLIDLDLAKEVGSGRSGARHQTDTMEFMAIEVLLNIDHTYRHDLESFFYELLWQGVRNGWGKNKYSRDSKLRAWYTGNYEDIANAKFGHMSKAENMGFGFILREFPPKFRGFVSLCQVLRDILFPYNDKGLIVGTPPRPKPLIRFNYQGLR
ncbi:hypothetical protein ACJ73_04528 [Blastomyces percursus]|uniref:Fungal-type protein kinase domain-containing protein n=1 Tax=Blastomyces percursus TaxID=1658174 RepID=A0A1J9Q6K5_9EURO|nr:hypothetical protein ACJ73_04528 [Blastomyces percursus]